MNKHKFPKINLFKNNIIRLLYILILFCYSCFFSCQNGQSEISSKLKFQKINTDQYQLLKIKTQKSLLILFPGYGASADDTEKEFHISDIAIKNNVSVLFMNFNQHLYLKKEEINQLEKSISGIVSKHQLSKNNIYIGGYSSGGNVGLILSNHLVKTSSPIQPKGVFIVDSPVDLLALYKIALKNIDRNTSKISVQESKWLKDYFDLNLGLPKNGINKYEKHSPFTSKSSNLENISNLKNLKIRLYTEPDTLWWRKNRQNKPEELNAHSIEKLAIEMRTKWKHSKIEYITTVNKGYRRNGDRHPHSWSIVDKEQLFEWIIK